MWLRQISQFLSSATSVRASQRKVMKFRHTWRGLSPATAARQRGIAGQNKPHAVLGDARGDCSEQKLRIGLELAELEPDNHQIGVAEAAVLPSTVDFEFDTLVRARNGLWIPRGNHISETCGKRPISSGSVCWRATTTSPRSSGACTLASTATSAESATSALCSAHGQSTGARTTKTRPVPVAPSKSAPCSHTCREASHAPKERASPNRSAPRQTGGLACHDPRTSGTLSGAAPPAQ
jgi:hypothetical protein